MFSWKKYINRNNDGEDNISKNNSSKFLITSHLLGNAWVSEQ